MSTISNDEKNIFLQDLEEEQAHTTGITDPVETKKHQTKKKEIGVTAIFAAFSVFFIFLILLMIFLLSIAGSGNPVFSTFGIAPYEIKSFLISLLNKSFLVIIVGLLLSTAIGIFRGYSIPKEEKTQRRGAFIFASVAGFLIFLSLLSWGGEYAYINKTVTDIPKNTNAIQIIDAEKYGNTLMAPIDIGFSIEKAVTSMKKKGFTIDSIQWSSDGGNNFVENQSGEKQFFHFTQKGQQDIAALVVLKNGDQQEFYRSFEIEDATFSSLPEKIHAKQKMSFDARDLISGGKKYQWDFDGDGIFDTSSSRGLISHTFKKAGTFEVTLRVSLAQKGFEVFKRSVRVYSESEASIVAEISSQQEFSGQAPYTLSLSGEESYTEEGTIKNYNWVIGKSKIKKKGRDIEYTFTSTGTHKVTLFIENYFGERANKEITVEITKGNSPPKAFISSLPKTNSQKKIIGKTPLNVKFSGEKSTDSDENITGYSWEIENEKGEKEEFLGSEISYNFRESGKYSVRLTVSDEKGEKNTTTIAVEMSEPSVLAVARVSPDFGSAPLIVEFNASESSCKAELCSITGFSWDFQDGTPIKRSGSKISHRFEKPGNYPVELTVHTNTGESNTQIIYVNVSEAAFTACFSASRTQGIAPTKISFDPQCSEGDAVEYKWNFGDGFISQSKRPSHTFRRAGEYKVTLNTINKNNQVSKSTQVITIQEKEE